MYKVPWERELRFASVWRKEIRMENKNENTFEYTYSSKRKEEIEKIRRKYVLQEEDKMEMLRKLDQSVEQSGTIASIIVGMVGTLILGIGMSLTLVWGEAYMVPGIMIGITGMIILAMAYPVYKRIVKKQREKIAPQIIELSEELLKH